MKKEYCVNGFLLILAICLYIASFLVAHSAGPGVERVSTPFGSNRVSMSISGGERLIVANGLPDHVPGEFPRRGNPNRISAQNYNFKLPLTPQVAARPTSARRMIFGVALNGVPFEPGTAEFWNNDPRSGWVYEAKTGFIDLGLDEHNAHVQPTGAYHYHGLPAGLIVRLGGEKSKMVLVGFAADGFPIYTSQGHTNPNEATSPLKKLRSSYRLKKGTRPGGPSGTYDGRFTEDFEYVQGSGDLDECNGRFGVTPEYPRGIYHYYITEEFPYISRLFRGTPDPSFEKRGGPGPRRPPRSGASGNPL